jgi:prefoldin subunit 5
MIRISFSDNWKNDVDGTLGDSRMFDIDNGYSAAIDNAIEFLDKRVRALVNNKPESNNTIDSTDGADVDTEPTE